jgi:hypothetical protein
MAYMHKKTFDILQDSNIDGFLDNYFFVDDPIALAIQTLNRKEYTTKFCCSGHPFATINEGFIRADYDTASQFASGTISVTEQQNGMHCIRYKQYLTRCSYIFFAEHVPMPEHLPDGWYWDDCIMSVDYGEDDDAYIFLEDLLYTMRELQRWAEALPPL